MKYFLLLIGLFCFTQNVNAQEHLEKEAEQFQQKYEKRVKKERLYGVYIPKDLADAFGQLNRLTAQSSRQSFKSAPEEVAARKLHFSLGRWITHNWGFYGGSRMSHYIKELGITHPDDQARFVIVSYHRYLNKKPLAVKEQVDAVLERQKKKVEERNKKRVILSTETRKRAN